MHESTAGFLGIVLALGVALYLYNAQLKSAVTQAPRRRRNRSTSRASGWRCSRLPRPSEPTSAGSRHLRHLRTAARRRGSGAWHRSPRLHVPVGFERQPGIQGDGDADRLEQARLAHAFDRREHADCRALTISIPRPGKWRTSRWSAISPRRPRRSGRKRRRSSSAITFL